MWNFIPFGGGPRTCPAQGLVGGEAAYVIARLAGMYERLECRDERPWKEAWRIGPHSLHGCVVGLVNEAMALTSFSIDC